MAWAFAQAATTQTSASSTTMAVTYNSAVGAGSLMVAIVSFDSAGGTTCTVSDATNGTWTSTAGINDPTNQQITQLHYKANAAAATPSVKAVTSTAAGFRSFIIAEYTGIATASPTDGAIAGTVKATGTSHVSGSVAVSQSGDLVLGFISPTGANVTNITSSDVTIHAGENINRLANASNEACGDKTGPASGTTAATFTFTTTSRANIGCICFKVAATGGADVNTSGPLLRVGVS